MVGGRVIGMKRLLVILVLLISFCNISYAEEIVNLPNDTSSGYKKLFKSLTGKYYKDHGIQVVNKKDGHPVRSGKQSIRFEVRSGDCGKDEMGEWNDCKNDRERHELSGGKKIDKMSKGEYWFAWSVYFPTDHQNLYPLSNNYGQFHQQGGPPVFMFKERIHGYSVVRTIGDSDYDERKLVDKKKMPGKWFEVLINAKWTKKDNGFFKVWVNDKLKYDYKGPTKTEKYVYQKFGIYRTGITRYLNYQNKSHIQKCLDENNGTTEEYGAMYDLRQKKIRHKISIQLYNKCKDYYEPINVPTTIVYFDEVRKGKSKESVTKNLTSFSN